MKLADFLGRTGWSKAQLSRKLGISKAAIAQWDDVPRQWVKVLELVIADGEVAPEPDRVVKPWEVDDLELLKIIRGSGKTADWQICQARGWRIWEFNRAIDLLIKKYPLKDPFWKQVKSETDIR